MATRPSTVTTPSPPAARLSTGACSCASPTSCASASPHATSSRGSCVTSMSASGHMGCRTSRWVTQGVGHQGGSHGVSDIKVGARGDIRWARGGKAGVRGGLWCQGRKGGAWCQGRKEGGCGLLARGACQCHTHPACPSQPWTLLHFLLSGVLAASVIHACRVLYSCNRTCGFLMVPHVVPLSYHFEKWCPPPSNDQAT